MGDIGYRYMRIKYVIICVYYMCTVMYLTIGQVPYAWIE